MSNKLRAAAKLLVSKNTISNRYDNAGVMLAKAWLTEHPAEDGGESVTDEWLEVIGFNRGGCLDVGYWVIECQKLALRLNSYQVKENPTRGDVRRLCKALGIELKEKS